MDERGEIRRYMSKYKNEKITVFGNGKIKGNKREREKNAFYAPSQNENKSRNLSEKKRRDQFNLLINELSTMVCPTSRKMDKSSVLRATIAFLKNHSELSVQSQNVEVQENWKPPFLSNEEFTHLMLEALDGFIIVFSCNGQILYSSESTASLLGYLPSRLYSSVFDIIHEVDKSSLYKLISNAPNSSNNSKDSFISLLLHMRRGPIHSQGSSSYELVNLVGTFYHWPSNIESSNPSGFDCDSNSCSSISSPLPSTGVEWRSCFIAVGRLQTPHLLRVVNLPDDTKNEFTSRQSLEWKFLFLDHRAPPIIGYLPFEVLGTSGYDYYHVDDLDDIAASHELLMQTGEGTSCFYRFLTKGQQWIWLQSRYYISYHQWHSKPEFIVCTHTVVSTEKVLKNMQDAPKKCAPNNKSNNSSQPQITTPPSQSACISPSPSVSSLGSLSSEHSEQCSMKTGSSNIHVNTVLYPNHGNKEKMVTSPLARAPASLAPPICQDTFMEPPQTLTPVPSSQASDLNIISSTDHMLPSTTCRELQVYVSASSSYSAPPSSSIIISTNVSGSQFQGERIQPSPEDIQYLSQRYQMLQQTIMQQQEELKRVSQQLRMAQYINPVHVSTGDIQYQTSDISSVSTYVNTYSAPSPSSHMLSPVPLSAENVIKSVDGYMHSTHSYLTSRSYQNLEADLCSVGTSGGLPILSPEQNNDVIAQSYSMTHSMQPNS